MKLWTYQHQKVAEVLLGGNVHRPEYEHSLACTDQDVFEDSYNYMIYLMKTIVGDNSVKENSFPVWCWYSYNDMMEAPQFEEGWVLGDNTQPVIFELEVDPSRVLVTDFYLWSMVINNHCVFRDEELKSFTCECNDGVTCEACDYYVFEKNVTDEQRKETWKSVIIKEDEYQTYQEDYLQATMWEIRPEDVISIQGYC